MNIERVKEKRSQLERDILSMIKYFEDNTGVVVIDLDLTRCSDNIIGEPRKIDRIENIKIVLGI